MRRRFGDRRNCPRFEIAGDLWGTFTATIGMPLINIGHGGALVQSPVPLAPESIHHVVFTCEGQHTQISVQVRHIRSVTGSDGPLQYLIGLAFLSMTALLAAQIDSWLERGTQVIENGL